MATAIRTFEEQENEKRKLFKEHLNRMRPKKKEEEKNRKHLESSSFSRGPPRTLLPDTTPKIPFPNWKIYHFIKENLPSIAFHQESSENYQEAAQDG